MSIESKIHITLAMHEVIWDHVLFFIILHAGCKDSSSSL